MTDRVLNNKVQKYSKSEDGRNTHRKYSFEYGEGYKQNINKDNVPSTQRLNTMRDNSSQLTGIQGDSLTSDLHDKMYLINEFRTAFNQSTDDDRRKWDKMFKVIPLSDEILKLPDDQRISSIYNDLLKYFFQIYATLDTFERREFFNQFPELRDMLSSKIKENIEVNKKFAKISTKGFKTAEDLKYLYDISHKLTDEKLSKKGYFSDKEKGLNTEIIQSLMSLKHTNYTDNENYATGHGDISETISPMTNHFSSGIIKRMWRDKFTEAGKAVTSDRGPRITSEPYQHFLFTLADIRNKRAEDVNDDKGLYRTVPSKTATMKDINESKPTTQQSVNLTPPYQEKDRVNNNYIGTKQNNMILWVTALDESKTDLSLLSIPRKFGSVYDNDTKLYSDFRESLIFYLDQKGYDRSQANPGDTIELIGVFNTQRKR